MKRISMAVQRGNSVIVASMPIGECLENICYLRIYTCFVGPRELQEDPVSRSWQTSKVREDNVATRRLQRSGSE